MIPVDAENDLQELGLDHETTARTAQFIKQEVNTKELIQIDHVKGLRLDQPQNRLAQAKSAFDSLQPGLTHFVIHPAKDSPELRAASPSTWQCRVGDYEVFRSKELRAYIKKIGIQVIGYRPLRNLL
jgi:hypothetical protein